MPFLRLHLVMKLLEKTNELIPTWIRSGSITGGSNLVFLSALRALEYEIRSVSKENIHYHQLVLTNRDALRGLDVVPLVPKGTDLETKALRAVAELFTKRVHEMERQSYGCSFIAERTINLIRLGFLADRVLNTTVLERYRINLTMTHPSEGLRISSMEFKSYWDSSYPTPNERWYHSNFNISVLYKIEERGRQRVAKLTGGNINLKQLRKACLSFIYEPYTIHDRKQVVKMSVVDDMQAVLKLYDKGFRSNYAIPSVPKSTFHAHLPNRSDEEVPVLDLFKIWSLSEKQ